MWKALVEECTPTSFLTSTFDHSLYTTIDWSEERGSSGSEGSGPSGNCMRHSQPLPEAHPELLVIETPGLGCEYRVENWRLSPSQHRLGSLPWVTRLDAFLVVLIGLLWPSVKGSPVSMIAMGIALAILVYQKLTQVLWESVLVLPPYGIQLETHRGFPSLPFFVSRKFIPLTEVQDVLINEGLRRWDVRYYLAVLYSRRGQQHVEVAFENLLPHFPVLIEVYHGVHKYLCNNGIEDVRGVL